MSQAGVIDIEKNNPHIATEFDANTGSAIPIANVLNIYGASVAAGTTPVATVGSGATITTNVQISQAIAATDATKIGLAAFNSADFSVDANGFVSISALAGATKINVDASTAPGTDPVVPDGSGIIAMTGAQVAAGTTANVIRTDSLAANSMTIEIQRSSAQASSTVGSNGVSHFDSTDFTVDANGFVALSNDGPFVESVVGTADRITSSGGVNPIIDIAATYVGQTSITTLGTIGTGTWQGTAVAVGFGGTGLSSTAANTMLISASANTITTTDFQQGSFTPTLTFGGASTGITYNAQFGRYTRIGNMVEISVAIDLSNKGSATGSAAVAGLPFTNGGTGIAGYGQVITGSSVTTVCNVNVNGSATTAGLQQINNATGGLTGLTDANFSNTSSIYINTKYWTS